MKFFVNPVSHLPSRLRTKAAAVAAIGAIAATTLIGATAAAAASPGLASSASPKPSVSLGPRRLEGQR